MNRPLEAGLFDGAQADVETTHRAERNATHVTGCSRDKYQSPRNASGTQSETQERGDVRTVSGLPPTYPEATYEQPTPDAADKSLQSKPAADSHEFDWQNDDSIVIRSQRATACYHNASGDIVIRQERDAYEDEDAVIVVTAENVDVLNAALEKLREEASRG